jgi:hypothetical protein
MFTDEELIWWNRRGLIPGPGQTEVQFAAKIELLEGLESDKIVSRQVFALTSRLFDIAPDWLSVIHRRKGLSFWEGAVTWQDQRPEGYSIPAIQIREDLSRSFLSRYYPEDEVLAHEIVHAVRADFEEPAFEEILAYQTAHQRWRRYFGPLLQQPRETQVFLGLLLLAVLTQWLSIIFDLPSWCSFVVWLPWLVLGCGLGRLYRNQRLFQRCLQNLGGKKEGLAIALRLTDAEIRFFAHSSWHEIREYIEREKGKNLRWKMLFVAYFKESS